MRIIIINGLYFYKFAIRGTPNRSWNIYRSGRDQAYIRQVDTTMTTRRKRTRVKTWFRATLIHLITFINELMVSDWGYYFYCLHKSSSSSMQSSLFVNHCIASGKDTLCTVPLLLLLVHVDIMQLLIGPRMCFLINAFSTYTPWPVACGVVWETSAFFKRGHSDTQSFNKSRPLTLPPVVPNV